MKRMFGRGVALVEATTVVDVIGGEGFTRIGIRFMAVSLVIV
jgi:hypothetical protein